MSLIRRLNAPLRRAEDVIPHLGAPHHWKEGRSAKRLIDQWWSANAIPESIKTILEQAPEWRNAELIDAFAERCTSLGDGRPSHSQSDLLAVIGLDNRLGIISIEAKVDEGFDLTIDQWLAKPSAGKTARLAKLCNVFKLARLDIGHLRYQLFHRSASAIIEAKRYRCSHAVMIVQSWSHSADGFSDYIAFFDSLGITPSGVGQISPTKIIDGVEFRTAWSAEV